MMLDAVMIFVIVSMGMMLLRAVLGSTSFDRILAANGIGTHVVVLIVLLGIFGVTEDFIDIALIYGLISFVSTVGYLMYFKYRREE